MSAENNVILDARGLCKDFAGQRAVAGVDVSVARGEIVGLLGTNGAGKSTTLQMLAGMCAPASGEVRIEGQDLYRGSRRVLAAVGYLPDVPPLYPELTVDEFLRHAAALRGVARAALAERVTHAKRQFDLSQVGRQVIGKLSRGFQQRVGLAQALIHQPRVVILDEPTLGLDPLQTAVMRRCILALRTHAAIVMSSHLLADVQALCGRVIILQDGRIAYGGEVPSATDGRGGRTRVVLRDAPALTELRAAPGVTAAEQVDAITFDVMLSEHAETPEQFVAHAVASGWRLAELRRESHSLEETFAAIIGRAQPTPTIDDQSVH